jgi:hypothetical protein
MSRRSLRNVGAALGYTPYTYCAFALTLITGTLARQAKLLAALFF